ncbi:UNVERIFIED_ORG: hypothetical protein J2W85_002248 [Ensifer adhaerens]|jgi:hypothetical protein|nr:hypothetical protein [Ensifer adhaerens]NOV21373.1 hypothetical protein [Ensifer canadensis]
MPILSLFYRQIVGPGESSKCASGKHCVSRMMPNGAWIKPRVRGESVSGLSGVAETLYLLVFTHFLTENRFALFLEML